MRSFTPWEHRFLRPVSCLPARCVPTLSSARFVDCRCEGSRIATLLPLQQPLVAAK